MNSLSHEIRGRQDFTQTNGYHNDTHLPAPKARSPEDDQSAAAGFRFPPMEIYGQLTSAMTLNDLQTGVHGGLERVTEVGKKFGGSRGVSIAALGGGLIISHMV